MEILSFDIVGKFAHFRKYFTNSSALSYFIPPRTTICGMIAGILGLPRDSYYEDFSIDYCLIGVRLLNRVKKSTHTLKYLKIESPNDLNGSNKSGSNTMVPFEFISPINISDSDSWVKYRIYYAVNKESDHQKKHFINLKDMLISRKGIVYPLTLGVANFTAKIENSKIHNIDESKVEAKMNMHYKVHSVVRKDFISDFDVNTGNHLIQETIPLDFNTTRHLIKQGEVIFDLNCNSLSLVTENPVYCLTNGEETENIIFL